jgi:hypothetical protein
MLGENETKLSRAFLERIVSGRAYLFQEACLEWERQQLF